MTEAGTHIGSGGPVPLPRSLPSGTERAAYRGPDERLDAAPRVLPRRAAPTRSGRSSSPSSRMLGASTPATPTTRSATDSLRSGTPRRRSSSSAPPSSSTRQTFAAPAPRSPRRCALPLPAARYVLFREVVGSPRLLELPPLVAIELQLGLLLGLDVLSDVTLWTRTTTGLDCIVTIGGDGRTSRRVTGRGEGDASRTLAAVAARRIAAARRPRYCASARRTPQSSDDSDRSIRTSPTRISARPPRRSAR